MTSSDSPPHRPPIPVVMAVAVAAILWLAPGSAGATVMEYASPSDLVELSDSIVRADVDDQRSFVDDEQERIVTHTTLDVHESYSGEVGSEVTIEQWGGTVGERTSSVPGDAGFETGEEVLVFLRRDPDRPDVLFLTALAQSKYTVDRTGESPLVARDFSDLVLMRADDGDGRLAVDGELAKLADFEARLRTLLDDETGSRR